MDNKQIDFNSYDWELQRDDRYTCKHCKKFLTFYQDNYICSYCGLVHKQIESFGSPYKPANWTHAVRFIQTTYIIEDSPEQTTKEKTSKKNTNEIIDQLFTEKLLDKTEQTELWKLLGKVSVAEYLKKNGYKFKYVKGEGAWSEMFIYKKVAA